MLVNKERVFVLDYLGMLLCFGGVLGIAFSKDQASSTTYDPSTRNTGLCISFALSWVFACVVVSIRRLKDVDYSVVLFYHSCFGFCVSTLYIVVEAVLAEELRVASFTSWQYLVILLGCTFDWLGLSMQTRAY